MRIRQDCLDVWLYYYRCLRLECITIVVWGLIVLLSMSEAWLYYYGCPRLDCITIDVWGWVYNYRCLRLYCITIDVWGLIVLLSTFRELLPEKMFYSHLLCFLCPYLTGYMVKCLGRRCTILNKRDTYLYLFSIFFIIPLTNIIIYKYWHHSNLL